ncbi:MAG: imidazole glycerol phosphate synthase subunit HisH, partial [Pseudomonadota bacterium]
QHADRLVLPGVGAFKSCAEGLRAHAGLEEAIHHFITELERPFLGICVGQQLMATRGLEKETTSGLGWIDGEVRAIEPTDPALKIPHMGWNTLNVTGAHPVLADIQTGPDGLHAYFVHSYHMVPQDEDVVLARADYGGAITAIVAKNNMVGTQFHPEKSQTLGLKLIANFIKWDV